MLEKYEDVLDVKDVCTILRIEKKTAYQLLRSGEIPCRLIGRIYRISKEAMIEYLKNSSF